MVENLVIVESPAKAKTIEKFLGKGFVVKSSFGHIRDLEKKGLGIDVEEGFKPHYIVPADKKKLVSELRKLAKEAKVVWLASDEDREGEAIAWHLFDELKLKEEHTKRIVFNSVTKEAILAAIENPRTIDNDLVDAQQARRILDRLVGFELSPILWRKVKPSLSAGRVQSVTVRLIVEREREIQNFVSVSNYRIVALFDVLAIDGTKQKLSTELARRFDNLADARQFIQHCTSASFCIDSIQVKPTKRSPSAPFTTSTLQQEASRKLGFSVTQTMSVAQRLYESGKITYMRTDSMNLAPVAIAAAKEQIVKMAGEEYVHERNYVTKSKGAQEAHEAIRPTYMSETAVEGTSQEQRLYDLIWKRTIASQMSDAKLEKTSIHISVSDSPERFVAQGEVLKFDGFLKVYMESSDDDQEQKEDDKLLPAVKEGDHPVLSALEGIERFSQRPARYNEASLVRKLEELGIGRPSTYAPTISTVQKRGYVEKEERPGIERSYHYLVWSGENIRESIKKEITGAEKNKLFPTDIGIVVNDYLEENFPKIMDYHFTANVEKEFDTIAAGDLEWSKLLKEFYGKFHSAVEVASEKSERKVGERILGNEPATGKVVSVRIGRFGPMVQIGTIEDEEKPRFSGLKKGQSMESITLEEAMELFKLPRNLGEYEGYVVSVGSGRFGPYVKHNNAFVSIKADQDDPLEITIERAVELIEAKREEKKNSIIKAFEEDETILVLKGRFGPYITQEKVNYKIPKGTDPESLSYEDVKKIMESQPTSSSRKKTTAKKTTAKKTTTTKKASTAKKTPVKSRKK